jgi:NADH dehydrogenase FAD-containing subunit
MQVDGHISPPTAQHALRQAKTCAENIARGKELFDDLPLGADCHWRA